MKAVNARARAKFGAGELAACRVDWKAGARVAGSRVRALGRQYAKCAIGRNLFLILDTASLVVMEFLLHFK